LIDAGEAIIELELAIAIIEKGNEIWSDVKWENKGSSFRPTFYRMMRAQLLREYKNLYVATHSVCNS